MSQDDICGYLVMLRKTGDHSFYSITDIHNKVGNGDKSKTWRQVNQLFAYGYLEIEVKNWKRSFRVKMQYVE